ncbi:LLM class flavin-dependent oxidoreductase [Ktedonosporobacter rubrisoli]|uniref:LLM class flavin-dependent oxidoreductase n=1 Tax=Ktedonosporobacter rubrisoli TaxID=2509675 RepID=A0A4P6JXQ1_KTERU|nr:LLM class flavin-dependent oxidoreductase [Ktedonosporobacter rubrisoli]QBD80212.1 LLM class flavin-dependent oxidoreductase [Ktedonosporobacter rubrisoli]
MMLQSKTKFGLLLTNRGVMIGATTTDEMLKMAKLADEAPAWDSVWVGDSIFAKPRLDSLVMLGGLATLTKRVRLGPACFASTPLRPALLLAYQWCSLDLLSGGRTIFIACQGRNFHGGGKFTDEYEAFHIDPATRSQRLEEAVEILRRLSSEEHVSYQGVYNQFTDVTVLPRPIQQPIPIWLVADYNPIKPKLMERALRRVAKYADGWMTAVATPEMITAGLEKLHQLAQEEGRTLPPGFDVGLTYNIHVNEDKDAAFEESREFLKRYYGEAYERDFLETYWLASGSPEQCAERLRQLITAGVTHPILRITGFDQHRQFERITQEVLPLLG